MSKPQVVQSTATFFDRYSRGEALPDEIDDFIDKWHDRVDPQARSLPLHEYLGMTLEEHEVWVHDAEALPHILIARRELRPPDGRTTSSISAGPKNPVIND